MFTSLTATRRNNKLALHELICFAIYFCCFPKYVFAFYETFLWFYAWFLSFPCFTWFSTACAHLQDSWWRPTWHMCSWPIYWILHFGRFMVVMNCLTAIHSVSYRWIRICILFHCLLRHQWHLPQVIFTHAPALMSEWVLFDHGEN